MNALYGLVLFAGWTGGAAFLAWAAVRDLEEPRPVQPEGKQR